VSDAGLWVEFLKLCQEHVQAFASSFAIRDERRGAFSVGCFAGWSDADVRIFIRDYAAIDPLQVYARLQPEGAIVPDHEFCPRDVWEASAAYREFYAPRDRVHSFGGMILCTPTVQSFVCFLRGKDGAPFDETEFSKLRALLPHLKRAALLHDQMQTLRMRNTAFTGHLDRITQALCLLDSERRVLYNNSAADALFARQDGIQIQAERLVASSNREDIALATAVSTGLGRETVGRATLRRTSDSEASYRLFLFPLSGISPLNFGVTLPVVAALIVDADAPPDIDAAVIRELFGLTNTESLVAVKLSQGQSPSEIAADLSVSVETVRTHLRHILSKTGTNRQGSLVSLVLRSVPFKKL
jgi:DNA-binding CsgD family transcriptional regulator